MTENDTDKPDLPTKRATSAYGKFAESALFITACTCAAYMVGWFYYEAYFNRLSIHHDSLNLSPIYYVRKAFFPVVMFGILIHFSLRDAASPPRTRPTAFRHNLILFVFAGLAVHFVVTVFPGVVAYFIFIPSFALVCLLVSLSLKRKSFANIIFKSPFPVRVTGGLVVFLGLLIFATFLGRLSAQKYTEGTHGNVITVHLHLKPSSPLKLPKEELLLILHANGSYYVIEKQVHLPEYPTVYVIPDSEVLGAVWRRIN